MHWEKNASCSTPEKKCLQRQEVLMQDIISLFLSYTLHLFLGNITAVCKSMNKYFIIIILGGMLDIYYYC